MNRHPDGYPWIGICLGDVTGIGPEVTLKAVARELEADNARYLLLGDEAWVRTEMERAGLRLNPVRFNATDQTSRVFIDDLRTEALSTDLKPGAPEAANAAMAWLSAAADRCLRGELDAMVTAPVNKASIVRAGHDFVGQTEFLSAKAGEKPEGDAAVDREHASVSSSTLQDAVEGWRDVPGVRPESRVTSGPRGICRQGVDPR